MKVKVLDRILLVFLMLLVLAVCALVILAAWRIIPQAGVFAFIQSVYSTVWYTLAASLVALIVLIIAVKLLFLRVSAPEPAMAGAAQHRVRQTEHGEVSISTPALESMVLREARRNQRIRDCRCALSVEQDTVAVMLAISVLPGTNLVETSTELQRAVKENIETLTGLAIREVKVTIESTEVSGQSAGNA